MKCSNDRNVPRNFLNLSKIVLSGALVFLSIIDLVQAISYSDSGTVAAFNYYTPVVKIASFVSLLFISFEKFLGCLTQKLFKSFPDARRRACSFQPHLWPPNFGTSLSVLVLLHGAERTENKK